MAKIVTAQPNTGTLVTAYARNLRIAPRKMRLVTNLVKNMRVSDALTQLQFTNKKGADMVTKLLRSAVANAENNFSLNRDNLYIKSITCDMGASLQRMFPRARGSAFMIRRKLAHVNVVLEARAGKAKKTARAIPEKKAKTEVVKTQEGMTGTPVETATKLKGTRKTGKATHAENRSDTVSAKSGPDEKAI